MIWTVIGIGLIVVILVLMAILMERPVDAHELAPSATAGLRSIV